MTSPVPDVKGQGLASAIRTDVLRRSKQANVGHIGSSLSIAEILAALYGEILRISSPDHPDRDRFILSKGHAGLALYAVLVAVGILPADALDSFGADGSLLAAHPEHTSAGIDFSTGSLGHGLSLGAGAALAARLQGSSRRIFVLVSDAECNEGSLWEAAMFARHHGLANLTAIVDLNGQQAFGYTHDVLDLSPLADLWRAFGWDVREADGHDVTALVEALEKPGEAPSVVVAHTTFGKGVSFMEGQIKWHYAPLSDDEFAQALREVEAAV